MVPARVVQPEFCTTQVTPDTFWQILAGSWQFSSVMLDCMRNLRSRVALFFNIKTSAALDQVEDPREVLDYAYSQQQVHLRSVKRGVIEVAAARRQLERQAERLHARIARLEEQARRALRSSREDLARTALERKQSILAELRALDGQARDMAREEERLVLADQQLSQRVESFRVHRTVASARYSAAEAQVMVGEALAGLMGDEELELSLAVERSDERIDRMHARAVAIDALTESGALRYGPGEDPMDRELDAITSAEAVEAELKRLLNEPGESNKRETDLT
jgi:phage shock protein A